MKSHDKESGCDVTDNGELMKLVPQGSDRLPSELQRDGFGSM